MKKTSIILILILVLSFFLRLSGINFGLPSKNLALTTYNPDEPLSFYPMEKWDPKKLYFHPGRALLWGGFHLYVLATLVKTGQIIGIVKLGPREFLINNLKEVDKLYIIGRLLMIISGVLSVFLIYLICKKSFDEKTGLIAGFIFAILPAHIVNSFYVRPDALMIFFALVSVWYSLKIIETGKFKFYVLSSFFVGLATATKLSGAVYGIFPLTAHFLSKKSEQYSEGLTPLEKGGWGGFLRLFSIPFICLIGFIIGCPYSVIDFNSSSESFLHYLKINFSLSRGTMNPGQEILFGTGWKSYFTYYLPYGIGLPLLITGVAGAILTSYRILKNNLYTKKFDILFFISGIIIFYVISSTRNQVIWYTLPVLPFFAIFSARLFRILLENFNKIFATVILIIVSGYTLIYSIANLNLYIEKNVREEASEWIEKNIPKGSIIAIPKSYFWTPAVLRQYNPPYKLLIGVDDPNLGYSDGIIGLKKYLNETEYIVLSEFEFREFVHPKIKQNFPEQARVLDEILNSKKFIKVAEFDKEAKFLWFKFKKNYPPGDWLIPNPKILIFKKLEI